MRLRIVPALALAFLALGVLVGSSSSATAPPKVDPFLGDWTASADSDALLAGNGLTISKSTKAAAKAQVGPEWRNASGTGYYDQYCGSGVTVYAYVTVAYDWAPQGKMGGCVSNKTGPEIVFAGLHKESGSVHVVVKPGGLDYLAGTWDTIEGGTCCVHHTLTADRASIHLAVDEQGRQALPKGHRAKFLLTKLRGLGNVSIQKSLAGGAYSSGISDATGLIRFRKWRLYAHRVVDEDRIVLKFEKAYPSYYQQTANTGPAAIHDLGVVVLKSANGATDGCLVGSEGTISIYENNGEDVVRLQIACCGINETFDNGKHGAKVGVALTHEAP